MSNGTEKNSKAAKVINIILNVLAGIFFVLCMFALIASISAKRNDGAANVFGYQMRVVISPSMEKCSQTDVSGYEIKDIPLRSMVFIEMVPENKREADKWYSGLKKGDVLTFRYCYSNAQMTITHRIVSVSENSDGGYTIDLQGDNVDADDPTGGSGVLTQTINTATDSSTSGSFNYIIGKVTGQSVVLGHIVYAISQPVGIALIVIVPCGIILILQIIRIIGVLADDKKNNACESRKDNFAESVKPANGNRSDGLNAAEKENEQRT